MTAGVDSNKLRELNEALEELAQRRLYNKLEHYTPYERQRQFHDLGATHRLRALIAANQVGKTLACGAETAMHASGVYPPWWRGKRFPGPILAVVAGHTAEATRDSCQKMLAGPVSERGTGMVPKDAIVDFRMGRGVIDFVDSLIVRHASGRTSTIMFKTYERGEARWAGMSVDFCWLDEEPPIELFGEALARISARDGGAMVCSFTPLLGMSDVVRKFLDEDAPGQATIRMELADAGHFTPEKRAQIEADYQPYERDARVRGIPLMGSGRAIP
jgi:phage terminase large subunit-like protein